jgi:hypothetical protein
MQVRHNDIACIEVGGRNLTPKGERENGFLWMQSLLLARFACFASRSIRPLNRITSINSRAFVFGYIYQLQLR